MSAPDSGGAANELLDRPMAIRVFICLSSAYFFSYALRTINAAIAPELVAEFNLTNAQLGYLSSAYFFAFALMQIPLGIWLDRLGSRRVHFTLLLLASAGCVVFASASTVQGLWIGRAMIGAGFAGGLMAALRVYRFWYAIDRQQQLVSLMMVVGTAGALMATVPSRMVLELIGWRGLFLVVGGLILVSGASIFLQLPRNEKLKRPEPGVAPSHGGLGFAGYKIVLRDPFFWRFLVPAIVLQGGFIAFQSLWAGPWLTKVVGLSAQQAAQVLFVFNLVLMFAYLALSSLVRVIARRGWTLLHVNTVTSVCIIVLHLGMSSASGAMTGIALWLLWAVLTTTYTPVQTWVCLTFPDQIAGRALTAFNFVLFSGVFLVQWLFGVLVDWCITWSASEADAFRNALRIWVGLEIVALAWMVMFRVRAYNERNPSPVPTAS